MVIYVLDLIRVAVVCNTFSYSVLSSQRKYCKRLLQTFALTLKHEASLSAGTYNNTGRGTKHFVVTDKCLL